MPKGDLKSHALGSKMATWASQVQLILRFLKFWGDAPKLSFFRRSPDGPKNKKNRAVERQMVEHVPPDIRERQVSGREGSPGSIERRTL